MDRIRDRFHFVYVIIDVVCLVVSFYPYYLWRYNPEFWKIILSPNGWQGLSFLAFREYTSIFLLWTALTLFSLHRSRLFTTDRSLSIPGEIWLVFKAMMFAILPTAAAVFMLQFKIYSRLVFISSWITAFILLSAWRIAKRVYIRYRLRRGLGVIRVLIVGEGPVAETIVKELNNHPYFGFEIAGILTRNKIDGGVKNGLKVLGNYTDLENIIQKYYIDEVFVADKLSQDELVNFVLLGRKLSCGIKIIPDGFEYIYGNLATYKAGYINFLEYGYKKLHGTELFVKRLFDITGAYLLLIILSPLFLVFSLLIKFEDKGPVFYVSKRIGRKNKAFYFYKFRSMIIGADKMKTDLLEKNEAKGPVFKIKKDPRITKTGGFMRRYSIDELPQLWNVLKGDMSLIGPRPPTPDEVEKYDIWQMRRLEVKPGITCLWQVRGRSNLSFYKWVKWDLWYIDNWSFLLDLRILVWTIPAVIKKEGAY